MQLFILFIFSAVVLGSGAMLSPAWPTKQPRIGLAAALCTALVVGGAVFWAALFGWDTLVIDYLLFALMSGVVLGGTLSQAQTRAEAKGESLSDAEQGWPGPQDLGFLAVVAILVSLPLLLFPLPLGADAPADAYLTLSAKLGGSFDSLAPFHPETAVQYAPGFHALTAYLSQQLGQHIPLIQFAVGSVLAFLLVFVAYDLGAEISDKRLGRAMAVALMSGLGLIGLYFGAQYTALLGLVFALGSLTYALRYYREQAPADLVGGGLLLGATIYADPAITLVLLLGFIPWLATQWLLPGPGPDRPSQRAAIGLALGMPLVALIGTGPWWLRNFEAFTSAAPPEVSRGLENIGLFVSYHGIWSLALLFLGAWVAWRSGETILRQVLLLCAVWMLLIFDYVVLGILPALLPWLNRYATPESAAWYGPVIPALLLGGLGILWLWDSVPAAQRASLRRWGGPALLSGLVLVSGILILGQNSILAQVRDLSSSSGVRASAADIEVMRWIESETEPDARLLNHPEEGIWAAVIAERDAIWYTARGVDTRSEDRAALAAFWADPAGDHEAMLREAGVTHILVPQSLSNPEAVAELRWGDAPPVVDVAALDELDYLVMRFSVDGAAVYALR